MKKIICIFSFLLLFFNFASAQGISSSELINNAKLFDGKIVSYKGEIVGEVMKRGDFVWVNIHDGVNAMGIWAPLMLTREIVYAGSFKAKGDLVEVSGVFHRACSEHGGDLDIHAQTLRKLDSGRLVQDKLNPAKVSQALILLGVLFLIWILTLFLRK